jgi:hypothetical protein
MIGGGVWRCKGIKAAVISSCSCRQIINNHRDSTEIKLPVFVAVYFCPRGETNQQ